MGTFERATVSLSYEELGAGEPALVFLHGWCDDGRNWMATAEAFAGQHRCVIPEMRGHGRSGMPRDHAFFPEALASDVVALCEALGIERPVLVGHSFGGFLAATIARRSPGFARAVVVEEQVLDFRGFHAQMSALEGVIRGAESHMAFRDQLFESMISPVMTAEGKELIHSAKRETPAEVGLALWAVLFEYTADEIAETSDRLMAALGRQPSMTVEATSQPEYHAALMKVAPEVRAEVIESGHWIHMEDPEAFEALLTDFLGGLGD